MYEISRLINHVIGENESKKRDIVEKLGCKNDMYKGFSRLQGLMQTGKCSSEIRENLSEALGIDKKLAMQKEIQKTQRQQFEKKRFKPYLWIEHQYDHILSKSYTNSNHYSEMKIIELPDLMSSICWQDQLKIIRRYINMNQKGNIDKRFGKIRNYIYFKDVNESYLFDTYGGLIKIESPQKENLQYAVS